VARDLTWEAKARQILKVYDSVLVHSANSVSSTKDLEDAASQAQ
jgi:hypothetical protein